MKRPCHRVRDVLGAPRITTTLEPKPKLLWASIPMDLTCREVDCLTIPKYERIKRRRELCSLKPLGLPAFWEVARHSKQLLILDIHFDEEAVRYLHEKIEGSGWLTELLLITSERKARGEFEAMRANHPNGKDFDIRVVDKGSTVFHDRFAVTDGELWHFGGTVGCLEAKMTAGSRGWPADQLEFIDLFHKLWGPRS